MYDLAKLQRSAQSRRRFLKRMGAAGIGVAALKLLEMPTQRSTAWAATPKRSSARPASVSSTVSSYFPNIPGNTDDTVVLNYALTLEYLEADLYRQAINAAAGRSNTAALPSRQSVRLKVSNGSLTHAQADVAFDNLVQFGHAEAAHRDYLIAAIKSLGDTPTSPNAGGYQFPSALPSAIDGIVEAIIPLEKVGVRAYLGALPYLETTMLAQAAAEIFSVEARHTAVLLVDVGMDPGPAPLSGDHDVTVNGTAVTYTSANEFEYYRTPTQVESDIAPYLVS